MKFIGTNCANISGFGEKKVDGGHIFQYPEILWLLISCLQSIVIVHWLEYCYGQSSYPFVQNDIVFSTLVDGPQEFIAVI